MSADWEKGYYCAVAALLRFEGTVSPQVKELFSCGGNPHHADPEDISLFKEYGLLENPDVEER